MATGCTACGGEGGMCLPLLRSIVHLSSMSVISWAGLARVLLSLHIPLRVCFGFFFFRFVLFCLHGVEGMGRDVYITNEEEPSAASQ